MYPYSVCKHKKVRCIACQTAEYSIQRTLKQLKRYNNIYGRQARGKPQPCLCTRHDRQYTPTS